MDPVGQHQYFKPHDRGENDAGFQGKSHQLGLLRNADASSGGRNRDGLKTDHFAQHAAGRVGSGDQHRLAGQPGGVERASAFLFHARQRPGQFPR